MTSEEREQFTNLLEKRMEIYPDRMDINIVAKITGYSRTTILRRVQNGDIFAVMMNDEYVISKEGVIAFFASDKAFRISALHRFPFESHPKTKKVLDKPQGIV